ncbi:MAG: hypothetical protein KDI01_00310 [Halioglobus sp.]|nr:hypothetical protein [Halioglobus sp.]
MTTTDRGVVGVISNPASGHNRDQFARIQARIERCPAIHHLITRSPADIRAALVSLAERGTTVLAINGGDGTSSAILGELLESGLFETPPLIALLPGGTANMNAGDIGIRGSLARATERFCAWCTGARDTRGKLVQRPLLRVTCGDRQEVYYGMFLGAGAIIQGTEYAHREIHARGLRDDFSLALGTLRTMWGVCRDDPVFNRHVAVDIALDGAEAGRHDTLILAVSTLQRLAFGMRPFWGSGPGPIRVTLIEQHCTRFARTFISILRGRANRNATPEAGYISRNTHGLRLTLDGKINLDGEILAPDGAVDIGTSRPLEFLRL